MPKPNARQRILAYLQTHHGVSAAEISRALRVTPANIRHHLSILAADGRAKVVGERRPATNAEQAGQGRGRPVQMYGLGDTASGDNLSELADAVLGQWLQALPSDQRDSALGALAAHLADVAPRERSGPVTRRLSQAIARLNALHYRARWEAHGQGPRVIFEHCPFAAILEKHPELCRMDALLLKELLGAETIQSAKLELNAHGLPFCMFVLK
jgi:predicted ArsR family transcriptional regulator